MWDKPGLTWVIGSWDEVTVEETGSDPAFPPVLMISGTSGLLTIRPPSTPRMWMTRVRFLHQLRDGADELATLVAARAIR
ncbi:hypothetical protein [Amycolatopsis sp. lyj-84]|uniref:hypothetical protein n=1 Tax=Amycolatopsis sp. lyj-84 TaxID=2789284 RepID=UPI00397815E6